MTNQLEEKNPQNGKNPSLSSRVAEGGIFLGVVFITFMTFAAIAIATPLILVATALSGLMSGGRGPRRWRSAKAL